MRKKRRTLKTADTITLKSEPDFKGWNFAQTAPNTCQSVRNQKTLPNAAAFFKALLLSRFGLQSVPNF